ncbi:hypothetical protein AMS60_16195 [Bacillus sp. FJAT-21945]|nr:hypothetical protein AMS60_16195 [Bacillus sp. FJAT-21945]
MLSEYEFLLWCEKNNISERTREYINKNIRFAQPARSVGGGGRSLSGKYPSKKMGVTIQWESGKVEGPAVLMLENDDDVLEYYDQPNKIKLNYISKGGKKGGTLYTPDFFVIRKNSAGWEEWKNEEDYIKVAKVQDWKFEKDENGMWRCPPGEEFAEDFGLTFKACDTSSINWYLHRNFVFLDDYLRRKKELEVSKEALDEIRQVIFQEPGITLKQLIDQSINHKYSADNIYVAIIMNEIFVQLKDAPLAEPESVKVFLHKEHAAMYMNLISCDTDVLVPSKIVLDVGAKILWDSRIWEIKNMGNEAVWLMSDGQYSDISRIVFDNMINSGKIICETKETFDNDPIIDFITEASEDDYRIANKRLRFVKIYIDNGSKEFNSNTSPKLRTVREWVSKYRNAEKLFGNGYVGLLPNDKKKGNRKERFSIEVTELMESYIVNDYENVVQKNKTLVYGAFKNACEERGYIAPSLQTFCEKIDKRPIEELEGARKGKRAKYQKETFYWELEETTPRHGDFPFNIGHLDHTELDIELVSSRTGKLLGKPYLTLMVDAFSRRVLAFYLSFESPSNRSCMMVFRDCVRRHGRLPQQIVVDNGKEFHSIYFETFLAMYEREPKWRPPAKPRYGSILERLFGTTNSVFIHNLEGNTKIMKNVRQVTKSVNPKTHAKWTLPNLSAALEEFFFDIYDTTEHPAFDQTPREAFEKGLFYSGERKDFYIRYDNLFEILTLPSTKTGEATIQQSGIKINYIYYWNIEFKSKHHLKQKVKVRFDPFNIGIAYAYVNKRWIKCVSQHYSELSKLTLKELKFITSEIKKSKQNHAKKHSISAQKIAKFIKGLESNEQYSAIKAKEEEMKKVIQFNFKNASRDENYEKIEEEVASFPIIDTEEVEEQILEVYGEF